MADIQFVIFNGAYHPKIPKKYTFFCLKKIISKKIIGISKKEKFCLKHYHFRLFFITIRLFIFYILANFATF